MCRAIADNVGRAAEPYLVPMLPVMLDRIADKSAPVRSAAESAADALVSGLNPGSAALVIQALLEGMSRDRAWQTKEASLKLLKRLAGSAKAAVQAALPELVPVGSECLVDAREQVGLNSSNPGYMLRHSQHLLCTLHDWPITHST